MVATAKLPDVPKNESQVRRCLSDKLWRLNHLYSIVDERGDRMRFKLNPLQQRFMSDRHGLDVLLKARQWGGTTAIDIDMLDDALFTPDLRCGIVAHTKLDAQAIFQDKIKFAYDNLPDIVKSRITALRCDRGELLLSNNSSIRVAVSFRSATTHRLHVSEHGKICAKYPQRAEELKTGTLPSVHPQQGGRITIESTAEGCGGDFYDMCQLSQADTAQAARQGRSLGIMQYRFHFFAWWEDPKNSSPDKDIAISDELKRYFDEVEPKIGKVLTDCQKTWYAQRRDGTGGLKKLMKREYPSTVEEAFESSVEGSVLSEQLEQVRSEGRITNVPHIKNAPVYTFWDLGIGHKTAIIWAQFVRESIRIIAFHQEAGRGMPYFARLIASTAESKGYIYGKMNEDRPHYAPHDIMNHEKGTGIILKDTAESLGLRFTPTIRPKLKEDGHDAMREILPLCWFDIGCEELIKALSMYRYEWDEELSQFKKNPLEDWTSDAVDAFQTLALAYRLVPIGGRVLGSVVPVATTPEYVKDDVYDPLAEYRGSLTGARNG